MSAGGARRAAWWVLVVALIISIPPAALLGGWQMLVKSHTVAPVADQAAERQKVTDVARTGTVKVLSYSPDTLDQDFSAACAMLTGDFLKYYQQFTSQVVGPAARTKRVTTSATVANAGVDTLTRDAATVLVFVNQKTTSQDQPSPATATSSVVVGLARVNGTWLINNFNPV